MILLFQCIPLAQDPDWIFQPTTYSSPTITDMDFLAGTLQVTLRRYQKSCTINVDVSLCVFYLRTVRCEEIRDYMNVDCDVCEVFENRKWICIEDTATCSKFLSSLQPVQTCQEPSTEFQNCVQTKD